MHVRLAFAMPADEDLTPESLAFVLAYRLDQSLRHDTNRYPAVNARYFDEVGFGYVDPDGSNVDCSSAMASLSQMPSDERRAWQ